MSNRKICCLILEFQTIKDKNQIQRKKAACNSRSEISNQVAVLRQKQTPIFLLHHFLLRLSWEKTVDCYSPGKGLMPAGFKVRTVPLDGYNGAFEKVSDPDFGKLTTVRVAPYDSGGHTLTIEHCQLAPPCISSS